MGFDLLVPRYNEPFSVIKPLLDSIAVQQNVDFDDIQVIIADDGSDTPLAIEGDYPFEIKYIECEHKGVSATRNAALDASKADYVMFCDIDDMFFNACGLWMIFREAELGRFDVMVSVFVEETRADGEIVYVNHEMDSTFVHGKVYRRKYLKKKQLRFNDALTVHEDSYFNILARECTKDAKFCPTPFYLWRWRDESVCRHDKKYILKTYNNMIESTDALIDEMARRNMDDKARVYAGNAVFDAYYLMNKPEWKDQENQEYRHSTEARFSDFFNKHKSRWDSLNKQEKMAISNMVRGRQVAEGMEMEEVTLEDWLRSIASV